MKEKERARKLWEELLSKNPTNYYLRHVIRYVASLRKEAGKILNEREEATPPSPTSQPPVHKRTKKDILEEMLNL